MRTKRAAIAPCGRMKWRSAKDSNLGHHCWCGCFQDSVLDQPDALRFEMAPPLGIAPSSHRLTGGPHTLCVERNALRGSAPKTAERTRHSRWKAIAPGRNCTCVVPFRRRMPVVCSATGASMKWSRASVLPRVSPRPKRGGLLSSSRAIRSCRSEMAACAGIAPATFRSTGGCSS